MTEPIGLPAFPTPLRWLNQPVDWRTEDPDLLAVTAGPRTDLFTDPGGDGRHANAPALVGRLAGDFTLSARIRVDLASTYDAGVLVLHAGEDAWAKLCLELSPQGRPTIVSVVTRGLSDDCNAFPVDRPAVAGGDVRLRIARVGRAYAFHAAVGDDFWHLIRYFALDGEPAAGFLAQSPTGDGCAVRFEEIRYAAATLTDVRNGT
jgi:regulation of enolase protein 1 (concanavalin A-like superfamily)